MDREDITKLAREAGATFDHMTWVERDLAPVFERFAALVSAAEREACAKVADLVAREIDDTNGTATYIAATIRARGEK